MNTLSYESIMALQKEIHKITKNTEWRGDKINIGERIAMCHFGLSKTLEIYRSECALQKHTTFYNVKGKGKLVIPNEFATELAACIIRILDLAEYLKIDMGSTIMNRMKTLKGKYV